MRHWKLILLVCMIAVLAAGAALTTKQMTWEPLRTAVTTDDTTLDGATAARTYQFEDKPSTAVQLSDSLNGCQIYFYGTDTANQTCNYIIYAYRKDGPAVRVCNGAFTLGTGKQADSGSLFYADTITVTDNWPTDVTVADSGNNRVATLSFDLMGYKHIYAEIDITGGTAASAYAEITGY